jgi:hypothetical protein
VSYNCVIILGPTAVGKTAIGVNVASYFNAEIISADSRQTYCKLDIGSGKDLDEYVVNGKSAIEWLIERYAVTTDKASGIVNNPNDWAREHSSPKYILRLVLSIITLSLKTNELVANLPKLNI